jgi:hypothetical protein
MQIDRIRDHEDWFLAIGCINLTSHFVSYLHMTKGNAPAMHERRQCSRRAFKNFCRIMAKDKRCFYEVVAQMQMYLYARWMKALKENKSKLPPNFQDSVN